MRIIHEWHDVEHCPDCEIYQGPTEYGAKLCWRVTGAWHGPMTLEQHNQNEMWRAIWEPAIRRQLEAEVALNTFYRKGP